MNEPDFVGLAREFHTTIHAIPALDANAFVPFMAEVLERTYKAGWRNGALVERMFQAGTQITQSESGPG